MCVVWCCAVTTSGLVEMHRCAAFLILLTLCPIRPSLSTLSARSIPLPLIFPPESLHPPIHQSHSSLPASSRRWTIVLEQSGRVRGSIGTAQRRCCNNRFMRNRGAAINNRPQQQTRFLAVHSSINRHGTRACKRFPRLPSESPLFRPLRLSRSSYSLNNITHTTTICKYVFYVYIFLYI